MTRSLTRLLDHQKLEKAIEIAQKLELRYDLLVSGGRLTMVFYLYKSNLGQYIELCRRLTNAELRVNEQFVKEPMESPSSAHIGEVSVVIPVLKAKP